MKLPKHARVALLLLGWVLSEVGDELFRRLLGRIENPTDRAFVDYQGEPHDGVCTWLT